MRRGNTIVDIDNLDALIAQDDSVNLSPGTPDIMPESTGSFRFGTVVDVDSDAVPWASMSRARGLFTQDALIFSAKHPQWQDQIRLAKEGRFIRQTSQDGGTWTLTGAILTLKWDQQQPEVLRTIDGGSTFTGMPNVLFRMVCDTSIQPAWWSKLFAWCDSPLQSRLTCPPTNGVAMQPQASTKSPVRSAYSPGPRALTPTRGVAMQPQASVTSGVLPAYPIPSSRALTPTRGVGMQPQASITSGVLPAYPIPSSRALTPTRGVAMQPQASIKSAVRSAYPASPRALTPTRGIAVQPQASIKSAVRPLTSPRALTPPPAAAVQPLASFRSEVLPASMSLNNLTASTGTPPVSPPRSVKLPRATSPSPVSKVSMLPGSSSEVSAITSTLLPVASPSISKASMPPPGSSSGVSTLQGLRPVGEGVSSGDASRMPSSVIADPSKIQHIKTPAASLASPTERALPAFGISEAKVLEMELSTGLQTLAPHAAQNQEAVRPADTSPPMSELFRLLNSRGFTSAAAQAASCGDGSSMASWLAADASQIQNPKKSVASRSSPMKADFPAFEMPEAKVPEMELSTGLQNLDPHAAQNQEAVRPADTSPPMSELFRLLGSRGFMSSAAHAASSGEGSRKNTWLAADAPQIQNTKTSHSSPRGIALPAFEIPGAKVPEMELATGLQNLDPHAAQNQEAIRPPKNETPLPKSELFRLLNSRGFTSAAAQAASCGDGSEMSSWLAADASQIQNTKKSAASRSSPMEADFPAFEMPEAKVTEMELSTGLQNLASHAAQNQEAIRPPKNETPLPKSELFRLLNSRGFTSAAAQAASCVKEVNSDDDLMETSCPAFEILEGIPESEGSEQDEEAEGPDGTSRAVSQASTPPGSHSDVSTTQVLAAPDGSSSAGGDALHSDVVDAWIFGNCKNERAAVGASSEERTRAVFEGPLVKVGLVDCARDAAQNQEAGWPDEASPARSQAGMPPGSPSGVSRLLGLAADDACISPGNDVLGSDAMHALSGHCTSERAAAQACTTERVFPAFEGPELKVRDVESSTGLQIVAAPAELNSAGSVVLGSDIMDAISGHCTSQRSAAWASTTERDLPGFGGPEIKTVERELSTGLQDRVPRGWPNGASMPPHVSSGIPVELLTAPRAVISAGADVMSSGDGSTTADPSSTAGSASTDPSHMEGAKDQAAGHEVKVSGIGMLANAKLRLQQVAQEIGAKFVQTVKYPGSTWAGPQAWPMPEISREIQQQPNPQCDIAQVDDGNFRDSDSQSSNGFIMPGGDLPVDQLQPNSLSASVASVQPISLTGSVASIQMPTKAL